MDYVSHCQLTQSSVLLYFHRDRREGVGTGSPGPFHLFFDRPRPSSVENSSSVALRSQRPSIVFHTARYRPWKKGKIENQISLVHRHGLCKPLPTDAIFSVALLPQRPHGLVIVEETICAGQGNTTGSYFVVHRADCIVAIAYDPCGPRSSLTYACAWGFWVCWKLSAADCRSPAVVSIFTDSAACYWCFISLYPSVIIFHCECLGY